MNGLARDAEKVATWNEETHMEDVDAREKRAVGAVYVPGER